MSFEQLKFPFENEKGDKDVVSPESPGGREAMSLKTRETDAREVLVGAFILFDGEVVKVTESTFVQGIGRRVSYVDAYKRADTITLDESEAKLLVLDPQEQAYQQGWTLGDSNS